MVSCVKVNHYNLQVILKLERRGIFARIGYYCDESSLAGYFVQDIVVAAVIGVVTGWCVGPLLPVAGHWLARSSIVQLLLQISVLALALSSQFFPYSAAAPKRVVLQHSFLTAPMLENGNGNFKFVGFLLR